MRIREVSRLLFLVIVISPAPTVAQHQVTAMNSGIPVVVPTNGWIPRWRNNWLVGCQHCQGSPILYTVDTGGRSETMALDIAASAFTYVHDVTVGADGSIAAGGRATSDDSRKGAFIVWISPDRSRQVVTSVWPYDPHVVTMGSDGTIWTVGAVLTSDYRIMYPNVLRHYSPPGQLLTSTNVLNALPNTGGAYAVNQASTLVVSADRVGWLTLACQYMEFSLDGVELGRYNCPGGARSISAVGGIAMSPSDDVVVGAKQAAPLAPLELNRATGEWRAVTVLQDSGNTNEILGFDGFTLMTRAGLAVRQYAWASH
jgi:hypothetical protein